MSRNKSKTKIEDETNVNGDVQHDTTPDTEGQALSGEDETSINTGIEHAPPLETTSLEQEVVAQQSGSLPGMPERGAHDGNTQISSFRTDGQPDAPRELTRPDGQPDGLPDVARDPLGPESAERLALERREGEGEGDYVMRLASYRLTASTGSLPGNPELTAHDGNSNASSQLAPGEGPPQVRNPLDQDDYRDDVRRGRLRQYVIEQGGYPPGAVADATDAELDAMYERAIHSRGTTPTPELALSPAQRAQQILQSTSRADKVALVSTRSSLTEAHAQGLSDVDLDLQVRAVVINEMALEEEKKLEELAKQRPPDERPYGGDAPKYYVAERGARYMSEGQMVVLAPGQRVDDRSANIEDLRKNGALLHEVVAPDPRVS